MHLERVPRNRAAIRHRRIAHREMLGVWFALLAGAAAPAYGQQYNSDNYWTAPHGTQTTVVTVGQSHSTLLDVVALFPGWEFNVGATLFRKDQDAGTVRHFSTTAYVKYMFYENEAKNGGGAVMAGTGVVPGFYQSGSITSDSRSYWAYAPVTLPFFGGAVSWDLMPGVTVNKTYGTTNEATTGFLYSTRLAVYKVIPQSAIVGEVFGTEGGSLETPVQDRCPVGDQVCGLCPHLQR